MLFNAAFLAFINLNKRHIQHCAYQLACKPLHVHGTLAEADILCLQQSVALCLTRGLKDVLDVKL